MSINTKSPKAAFSAFRQDQQTGSVEKSLKDKQLQRLLDGFKEKHPVIADSIRTDKGVKLMAVDGRITARVINHFTKKQIPVLTVHDSYITPYTHTGELRRVMNDAVAEELKGFKINIDQEGAGIDQLQAFKNMDRTNALDYNHSNVPSYSRTEGYDLSPRIKTMTLMRFPINCRYWRFQNEEAIQRRTNHQSYQAA